MRTYDVHFSNSTNKGFNESFDYCKSYIEDYNGTNESYFEDYKGGNVSVMKQERKSIRRR